TASDSGSTSTSTGSAAARRRTASELALLRGVNASEKCQVPLDLPGRDLVVVVPPLSRLQVDVRGRKLLTEDPIHQRVGLEGFDRLQQRPREGLDSAFRQFSVGKQVHVLAPRLNCI